MKPNFLKYGAAALLLSSSLCFAQGEGVRGGGQVVEVNGKLELTDLTSSATLDCRSGPEMMQANPKISSILQKVSSLDWYFASEMKREILFLNWCFTGPLYQTPPTDADSFVIQLTKGVQQVAYRLNGAAYIDQAKYDRLSDRSKAFLIFHEMLHSYLDMNEPMRKLKLMTMVQTLSRVEAGQLTTRDALHRQMTMASIQFPLTVSKLDRYRKAVEFILSSVDEKAKAILSTLTPEDLIRFPAAQVLPYLSAWDRPSDNLVEILEAPVAQILRNGVREEVEMVLLRQKDSLLNPATIGLSILNELSDSTKEVLSQSPYLKAVLNPAFNLFSLATLSQSDFRILASPALQKLSSNPESAARPFTELRAMTVDSTLPYELKSAAQLLVNLVHSHEWNTVVALYGSASTFRKALSLQPQMDELNQMKTPIEREKPLAIRILKEIQAGVQAAFLNEVNSQLSDAEKSELNQKISN